MPDITITVAQKFELDVSEVMPDSTLAPASPIPVWTQDNAHVVLTFPNGVNTPTVTGSTVGTTIITATSGDNSLTYTVAVVANAATGLQFHAQPVRPQFDLQQGRGRGLGIGYA